MGLFRRGATVKELIDKGLDIGKEAVTDKDKLNELQYTLMQARAELMLGGKGASITKWTICALVAFVVGVLSRQYFVDPANMNFALQYSAAVSPLIGMLMGVYGTARTLQKKWENGKR